MGTAVHAGSIVHDNAPHHGTLDRSRVGRKFSPVRLQQLIDPLPDDARLQANLLAFVQDFIFFPVLASHDSYGIADGLPGKAGASGPECDGKV